MRKFLAESLVVWRVRGSVTAGASPAEILVHAGDEVVVRVEPAQPTESPIRWWVRWQAPGAQPHSRPCTSTVGLLRTVREAIGAEGGYHLRIAAGGS